MKKIKIVRGVLDTPDIDFTNIVTNIIAANGLPAGLSCCTTTSPTDGQLLAYNATTKAWEPITAGAGGLTNLAYTASPLNGIVTNTNGTAATLPLVTTVNAGLATPAMATALAATTPTNAQIGVGNSYVQVVDPATGAINFVVDGVVEMTIAAGKITIPNILDPLVYAGTPMTTAARNAYPNTAGYLIYNLTTGQYEYNNGTTWLPMGGSATLTNGNIFVGNVSNVATSVTMSGDVTITNAGVSTVLAASTTQSGKVELATTAETETGTDAVRAITPIAGEATYIKKSLINAKGDLIVGTADNVSTVLGVGTNNNVLISDSSQATGLRWGVVSPTKYVLDFIVGTWVIGVTESSITIPFSTHAITNPTVTVRELTGVLFKDVGVVVEVHSTTNDIVIYVTNGNTFAGRVIVL